jgi:hypothetical protein
MFSFCYLFSRHFWGKSKIHNLQSKIRHKSCFFKGDFFGFLLFMYDIQHCFICRPSDSTVSEDALYAYYENALKNA